MTKASLQDKTNSHDMTIEPTDWEDQEKVEVGAPVPSHSAAKSISIILACEKEALVLSTVKSAQSLPYLVPFQLVPLGWKWQEVWSMLFEFHLIKKPGKNHVLSYNTEIFYFKK